MRGGLPQHMWEWWLCPSSWLWVCVHLSTVHWWVSSWHHLPQQWLLLISWIGNDILITGGEKCDTVAPSCGDTYSLESGQQVNIKSSNYPSDYEREDCAYLFTAPANHYLRLSFNDFSLSSECQHFLDVRNNLIGQVSYQLYAVLTWQQPTVQYIDWQYWSCAFFRLCGQADNIDDVTTRKALQKDKMLVVFQGSDSEQIFLGRYSFTVTAVPDACLNDPCHGAPCQEDGNGGYTCKYLGMYYLTVLYSQSSHNLSIESWNSAVWRNPLKHSWCCQRESTIFDIVTEKNYEKNLITAGCRFPHPKLIQEFLDAFYNSTRFIESSEILKHFIISKKFWVDE